MLVRRGREVSLLGARRDIRPADPYDDAPPGPGPGLKILLADDHAINRFIASNQIRRLGHAVTSAVTPYEVIALCEHGKFDLILLEAHLGGESGAELVHRIRALQALRGWHCPIVALCAHPLPADRLRCIEAGMDDYLAKPVDEDRLEGVLRLVFSARRPRARARDRDLP